jgi:hypothetical protein
VRVDESLPLVRLSMDERWAVCASVPCGERFAKRIEMPEGITHRHYEKGSLASEPRRAVLDFVAGWVLDGDTWRMSKRARQRLSEGKPPAFRRPPMSDERDPRRNGIDPRSDLPKWDLRRDRSYNASGFSTNEYKLPAFLVCPACGLRQVADAVVLDCI